MGTISIGDVDIFDATYEDPNYIEYSFDHTETPLVLLSVYETFKCRFPMGDAVWLLDLIMNLKLEIEKNPTALSYQAQNLNVDSLYTVVRWEK